MVKIIDIATLFGYKLIVSKNVIRKRGSDSLFEGTEAYAFGPFLC